MLQERGQQLSLQRGQWGAHPSSIPTPWRPRETLGDRRGASRIALREQLHSRAWSPGHQTRPEEERREIRSEKEKERRGGGGRKRKREIYLWTAYKVKGDRVSGLE